MAKEENIILPVAAGLGLLLLFSGGDKEPPRPEPPPGSLPTDFIKKYWQQALQSQQATTIPALFTITQGGLESGWGQHAPGNMIFGIKAGSKWTGATQLLPTWECGSTGNPVTDGIPDKVLAIYPKGSRPGVCGSLYPYRVLGKFRAYGSVKDSFIDHGRFFFDNPRYHDALQYRNDNIKFARAVAAAGYAKDPNYANSLIAAMKIVVKVLQAHGMI